MKRRSAKKHLNELRKRTRAGRIDGRERDRHDRIYVLAFMRRCIEILSDDGDVNGKVHAVAAVARRLAPAIRARRASPTGGTE